VGKSNIEKSYRNFIFKLKKNHESIEQEIVKMKLWKKQVKKIKNKIKKNVHYLKSNRKTDYRHCA